MRKVVTENLFKRQNLWKPVHKTEKARAEVGLHLCVFIQLIQDNLRNFTAFEFDDNADFLV